VIPSNDHFPKHWAYGTLMGEMNLSVFIDCGTVMMTGEAIRDFLELLRPEAGSVLTIWREVNQLKELRLRLAVVSRGLLLQALALLLGTSTCRKPPYLQLRRVWLQICLECCIGAALCMKHSILEYANFSFIQTSFKLSFFCITRPPWCKYYGTEQIPIFI